MDASTGTHSLHFKTDTLAPEPTNQVPPAAATKHGKAQHAESSSLQLLRSFAEPGLPKAPPPAAKEHSGVLTPPAAPARPCPDAPARPPPVAPASPLGCCRAQSLRNAESGA